MKISALILGILGGIGAFITGTAALLIGGVGQALGAEKAGGTIGLGWLTIPLSLIGIIGGALAIGKPTIAGILMLISGIGAFFFSSGASFLFVGYLFAGSLLITGGILALVARKSVRKVESKSQNT